MTPPPSGPPVRESYARLAAAQKSGAGVPWYMRVVNRRLGRAVAAVAARHHRTPDEMTVLSLLLFVAGAALLAVGGTSVLTAVVVVLLLQAAFAVDAADGQLARLTGTGSVAGEWLDHVTDAGRHVVLHLAVLVGLDLTGAPRPALLLPLLFAVVASVRFFAQNLAEQLEHREAGRRVAEPVTGRGALVQLPADTGVVNLAVLLWPWPTLFLLAYGVLAAANTLLLAATVRRRLRALRALSAVPVP